MIDSIYPFMFSNIINDIYSFSNHKVLSVLSIVLLLIAVMHICINPKQNTHQVNNNQQEHNQNDKHNHSLSPSKNISKFGVYLATVRSTLYAWTFVFATKNTYLLWTFAIIILHVAIVSMQLTDSREIWLELLIRKKVKLYWNIQLIWVLSLIAFQRHLSFTMFESTTWLIIMELFIFMLISSCISIAQLHPFWGCISH